LEILRRTPQAQTQRMFDWPFALSYSGEDVKDELVQLGAMVCDVTETWPPVSAPAVMRRRTDRLRLGIATSFFWRHSVWKILTRGWLKTLDRRRFEVIGYNRGLREYGETALARTLCDRFRAAEKDLAGWARQIADDGLDCLLYPEIGMDRPTVLLASMRLAPLQAIAWGHPVTSGLRTIDWYFSSDLMEPPDGDNHYAEKLIRLENLSICYDAPEDTRAAFGRQRFNIGSDRLVYLCCQNLSKYLPSPRQDLRRFTQGRSGRHACLHQVRPAGRG
jgi:predicted O-linked N-acetylglucosamine transferase (SPINDLY family)